MLAGIQTSPVKSSLSGGASTPRFFNHNTPAPPPAIAASSPTPPSRFRVPLPGAAADFASFIQSGEADDGDENEDASLEDEDGSLDSPRSKTKSRSRANPNAADAAMRAVMARAIAAAQAAMADEASIFVQPGVATPIPNPSSRELHPLDEKDEEIAAAIAVTSGDSRPSRSQAQQRDQAKVDIRKGASGARCK